MEGKTLIVITGPTGVGKTEATLQIAEHFNAAILNADSRQLYSEIAIGTAAPTQAQQSRIKHYFVGSRQVTDYYSASMYEMEVLDYMKYTNDKITVMSGGSMMYIDAVCKGIDDIPTILPHIRQELVDRYEREGLHSLCKELQQLDPDYYSIVDKQNTRRVLHALEVCLQTGKTYSSFRTNKSKNRPFNIIKIGLNRERNILYERINARVLQMIENGMIDEAKNMYRFRGLNALNTVGYKELFDYLDGLTTLEEAIIKIQNNSRRYARKQLTWFNRDKEMVWFNPDNIEEILNYIHHNLNNTIK